MGAAIAVAVGVFACHSPGPYGHSKVYSPLEAEADAAAKATDYDSVMAQRFPDQWKGKSVSVFGVVKSRRQDASGATKLTMSVRALAPRNLCDVGGENTCRVTVSDREYGVVHALVKLRAEERAGDIGVDTDSLMRIIGVIGDQVDPQDSNPVISTTYYRHWPRNYYVTASAQSYLRR
jgi:hypothetical protein